MYGKSDSGPGEPPEHGRCANAHVCLEPSTWRLVQSNVDHGQGLQVHQLWHSQRVARGLLHTSGEYLEFKNAVGNFIAISLLFVSLNLVLHFT